MILDRLRRKKKTEGPRLSRSEFLRLKPVWNPLIKWEKNEKGEVKITIPFKKIREKSQDKKGSSGKFTGVLSKIFPEPEEKRIRLDQIGSIVWELCDGERTVKEIVDFICEKYKLLPRETEVSLSTYLNSLVKRGLIGFIVPEDVRKRLEEKKEAEK